MGRSDGCLVEAEKVAAVPVAGSLTVLNSCSRKALTILGSHSAVSCNTVDTSSLFHMSALSNIKEAVSDYGQNLSNASSIMSSGDIIVVDSQDKPVSGITVPADIQTKLQEQSQSGE